MDSHRISHWETMGQAKIVLQISNEKDLNEFVEKTVVAGIPSFVVERVFGNGANEKTLLAIGPGFLKRLQRRN